MDMPNIIWKEVGPGLMKTGSSNSAPGSALYNVHGIVMVMDLKKVFRTMIQVDFIDVMGLMGYGADYVEAVVKLLSNGDGQRRPGCVKVSEMVAEGAFLGDMKQWWSRH
ncbi:hypothetical protein [Absidia glauca]|uniref:Uncharacterized protein n=1 Tax=Absidia glauca TaxID=4829 RepID=A0A163JQD8_ABSGL|nr:hypothetical protein [Absidia glauca]